MSPPHLLGCLLHLLVVVIPAESRAGIRDSPAALGWGWGNGGGGAVPGQLVPSDVVHEAVAHVQPPARLAAEPRPGVRRRCHREPWRGAAAAAAAAATAPIVTLPPGEVGTASPSPSGLAPQPSVGKGPWGRAAPRAEFQAQMGGGACATSTPWAGLFFVTRRRNKILGLLLITSNNSAPMTPLSVRCGAFPSFLWVRVL